MEARTIMEREKIITLGDLLKEKGQELIKFNSISNTNTKKQPGKQQMFTELNRGINDRTRSQNTNK